MHFKALPWTPREAPGLSVERGDGKKEDESAKNEREGGQKGGRKAKGVVSQNQVRKMLPRKECMYGDQCY